MRKVVSNSEVGELFNNQQQEFAQNSSNTFYFRGNTTYSYGSHFPISKFENFNNKNILLFTLDKYSNTTAKHINIVRSATRHHAKLYVPQINKSHKINFNIWESEIKIQIVLLSKCKNEKKYIDNILYIKDKIEKYCEFYEILIPENIQKSFLVDNKNKAKITIEEIGF